MNLLVNNDIPSTNHPPATLNNLSLVKLKEGSFFKETLSWYNQQYLHIFSECAWLWMLVFLLLGINSIPLLNIYKSFPLSSKIPVVIYEENPDALNIIKRLPIRNNETLQEAIGRYLVTFYVKMRESYSKATTNYQYWYVKNNSTYDVYNNFIQNIEGKNISANNVPISTMETKNIEVTDITLQLTANFTTKAFVKFNVIVNNKIISAEKAIVEFRLSDVLLSYKKIIPLEFIVINYEK